LAPVARESRTVVATVAGFDALGELALALAASPVAPTAVEIESSPIRLLIRFETTRIAVNAQAASAAQIAEQHGASVTIVDGVADETLWTDHDERLWKFADAAGEAHRDFAVMKTSVLPSKVGALLERNASSCAELPVEWWAAGRALGVLFFRFAAPAADLVRMMSELRRIAQELGGTAVVLQTAPDVRSRLNGSDDLGETLPLMRRIKAQFDPHGILSPGRGPGGI
jgi:glycolate oxidase FAD binding subunit